MDLFVSAEWKTDNFEPIHVNQFKNLTGFVCPSPLNLTIEIANRVLHVVHYRHWLFCLACIINLGIGITGPPTLFLVILLYRK